MPKRYTYLKKLVIVGESGCGKTSLLHTFVSGKFPGESVPEVSESAVNYVTVDSKHIVGFSFWDKTGDVNYADSRILYYLETDVVLVCFSIDNPDSLKKVEEKWQPEVEHFCPKIPLIVVGLKRDLRDDRMTLDKLARLQKTTVSYTEAEQLANRIGARAYLECSAKEDVAVQSVFEKAALAVLSKKRASSKICQLS